MLHCYVKMEACTCVHTGMKLLLIGSALLFLRATAVDVTAETGEDVTLICGLGEDYPEWIYQDGNALTANNAVTTQGMEYVDMRDLRITNVKMSHAGDYTCRGANNAENTVTLIVNSFDYDVSFSDVYSRFLDPPYIPVLSEQNLTVTCTVENAFPEPQVALGFLNPSTHVINDVTVVSSELQADNTYTVVVSGLVLWSEEVDEEIVFCNATRGDRFKHSTQQLKVVYPPTLFGYQGIDKLEAEVSTSDFICYTDNTYPTMDFLWVINGSAELLPGFTRPDPTKCKSVQGTEDYLRSTLYNCETQLNFTALPKEYNGIEVYCAMSFLGKPFIQETRGYKWTLSLAFPPTTATIQRPAGPIRGEANAPITVACMTDSARMQDDDSGVTFKWFINDVEMEITNSSDITEVSRVEEAGENGGYTATQTVRFPATKDMNGATLSCRARNYYQKPYKYLSYVEDSRKLKVDYAPILIQPYRSEFRAYYGVPVEIPCSVDSDPVSTITWLQTYPNGSSSDVPGFDQSSQTGNLLVLKISPSVPYLGSGVYRCVASNDVGGSAMKDVQLIVTGKPADPSFGVVREEATSFTVEINMPYPDGILSYVYVQYRWIGEDRSMYQQDATWSEADKRFPDADYGSATDTVFSLTLTGLQPGAHYETRLKMVDSEGITFYSLNALYPKTKETSGEGLKTYSQYRDAILICVLVTFGGMLIVLIVAVVCVKRGACGKQKDVDMVAMNYR